VKLTSTEAYQPLCTSDRHRHSYPLSVYACPNGHEPFYVRAAGGGSITWSCPDCRQVGTFIGCDGGDSTWMHPARPVAGMVEAFIINSEEVAS